MTKLVVLIPTYNESKSVLSVISDLQAISADVIVIDDNSPDGTADLVESLKYSNVRVIKNGEKNGIGAAYIAGFKVALHDGYEFVATMDADGSHLVQDLESMMLAISDSDVVMGTRWIPGGSVVNWSLHRELLSRFGTWFAQKTLALPYKDLTGGLRLYRAKYLHKLNLGEIRSNGYCFQIEMIRALTACGAAIKEVPITFIERGLGESKMSKAIVLEAFWRVSFWGLQRTLGHNADKLHYVK